MLNVAADAKGNPTERFELLNMTREQALRGEDLATALEVVAKIDADYKIDGEKLRARTFYEAVAWRLPDAQQQAVAKQALKFINNAVAAQRLDLAGPLAEKLRNQVRHIRDRRLRESILDQAKRVERAAEAWAKAQPARDRLQLDADDPQANDTYGKFLCWHVGNWDAGLKHLTKGNDDSLRQLAQRDLARPLSANAMFELANAWWALAEKKSEYEPCRPRAGDWYQQAHASGKLNAIDRLLVEKRLQGLDMPLKPVDVVAKVAPEPAGLPELSLPQPPQPASKPTSSEPVAPDHVATFVAPDQSERLAPVKAADGKYASDEIAQVSVLAAEKHYLYFRIDDAFLKDLPDRLAVRVIVSVLDTQRQSLDIEYDGYVDDPKVKSDGRYRETQSQGLGGSGRLRHLVFTLNRPRFSNRQNFGGDFRLRVRAPQGKVQLAVHQVRVIVPEAVLAQIQKTAP